MARVRNPLLWMLIGPSFIYGTIVAVTDMVLADDSEADIQVFLVVLASIVIFWIAHAVSEIVAGGPAGDEAPTPAKVVVRHALEHSVGLLAAAILPMMFLLLGALAVLDEYLAYYLALAASILTLGVVGWLSVQRRGYIWPWRLLGALGSVLLGVLVVILKAEIK
ncbi:MAG: hypothetical protein ABIO06_04810 [Pseudolysinimonas sp.]